MNKALDLIVNQSPGATVPLFDPTAQRLIGYGVLAFFLLWGLAKVIKVWRKM